MNFKCMRCELLIYEYFPVNANEYSFLIKRTKFVRTISNDYPNILHGYSFQP